MEDMNKKLFLVTKDANSLKPPKKNPNIEKKKLFPSIFFPGGQNTLKNHKKTMSGNIYCGHRLIFLYMLVYIRTILGFFNRSIAFSRFS